MECHVYLQAKRHSLAAFAGPPSWVGSEYVLLGMFEFDKMTEPTVESIRNWAIARIQLLGMPLERPPQSLNVVNYATHAYWGLST